MGELSCFGAHQIGTVLVEEKESGDKWSDMSA